jgi:hypothetical protein
MVEQVMAGVVLDLVLIDLFNVPGATWFAVYKAGGGPSAYRTNG